MPEGAEGTVPAGGEGAPAAEGAGPPMDAGSAASTAARPPVPVLRLDWRSGAWIAGGIFTGLVLLALLRNVPASLTRIGVGFLLAFALDPLVVRVRRRFECSRAAAVAVVGGAAMALFALLIVVLGPPAVEQAREFSDELPQTVEDLYGVPIVGAWLEDRDAAGRVERWAEELPARLDTDTVAEAASTILDGVVAGIVVVVVGVAVLLDGDRLVGRLLLVIPDQYDESARRVGRTFYRTVGAYFSGSLLVATLAATFILAVGLAFGVPLAPAAALWMLVVNLIPQIGGLLGGGLFTLLAFTQSATTGVVCLLLYLVYSNLENHVIAPAIVGEAVDLSPPATMLAALIGGAAAGVPGALVATPLVGAVKSLYLELRWGKPPEVKRREPFWTRWRRRRKRSKGDLSARR